MRKPAGLFLIYFKYIYPQNNFWLKTNNTDISMLKECKLTIAKTCVYYMQNCVTTHIPHPMFNDGCRVRCDGATLLFHCFTKAPNRRCFDRHNYSNNLHIQGSLDLLKPSSIHQTSLRLLSSVTTNTNSTNSRHFFSHWENCTCLQSSCH